jgi:hypothetical protein
MRGALILSYTACAMVATYSILRTPKPCPVLVVPPVVDLTHCKWTFGSYTPSAWEALWTAHVNEWQDRVCEHTDALFADAWVAREDGVFSHMAFVNSCTGETLVDSIEPLAGLTRHPYYCLKGGDYLVDKSYIQVPTTVPRKLTAPTSRLLYFDLGASLYDTGGGGASQEWIVDEYERTGVQFSGIWAWEAQPHPPEDVWNRVPSHLKPIYHWYNIAANPSPGHADNALEYIRRMATADDYVVVKIDIDNNPVEETILQQITESDDILALIDELYFEHHVDVAPMHAYWGRIPGRALADTYALFAKLRQKGVLAHSWV